MSNSAQINAMVADIQELGLNFDADQIKNVLR